MDAAQFFIELAGILIAVRLAGELAVRMGAPSVIGEVTAGIILGPSVLGWLAPTGVIRLMAEIGIIMLLFEVGLIFAELGRSSGVFDGATYAAVVLVVAYTTLFSPFWIKLFYRLFGHRPELLDQRSESEREPPPEPAEKPPDRAL